MSHIMEFHEREFFVYRIIAGYTKIIYNNVELKIYPPSDSILYDAQIFYNEIYNECRQNNINTEKEMSKFLIDMSLWSNEEEERIKSINESLDDIKVKIYNSVFNEHNVIRYKSNLRDAEKQLMYLLSKKRIYDAYTCEGISQYAKLQFIIEKTTKCNKQLYNWKDVSISTLFSILQSQTISDKIIRFLSHNEPWNTIWNCSKKCGKIFKNRYLSDDQRRILSWTSMYDNIYKSQDCPHDSIIDDDDMLDGWLIIQRREREQKQKQKRGEGVISDKIAASDEVFIVAHSVEDAKKIYDMNSNQAKSIIESRKKKIKNSNKDLDIREFDDIKIKILNEVNKGK